VGLSYQQQTSGFTSKKGILKMAFCSSLRLSN
jgi:hypothetical protein